VRLEIACGERIPPGWTGMDISDEVKPHIHHDARIVPWPIEDGAVDESRCKHFFEHLDPADRIRFMNELYRVTKPAGLAHFITPLNHWRQVQDFDHKWPPIVPGSFSYFSRQWLESQRLGHYRKLHGIDCDWVASDTRVVMNDEPNLSADRRLVREHFSDPRETADLIVTLRRVE
jgi:predicted SAM-dependent methyltransferase